MKINVAKGRGFEINLIITREGEKYNITREEIWEGVGVLVDYGNHTDEDVTDFIAQEQESAKYGFE